MRHIALLDFDQTLPPIASDYEWSRHRARCGLIDEVGLDFVTDPVVTEPDPMLASHARERGWPAIRLFR